ncbi:MAG: DUF4386 domain-containing protein [Candidatus Eremiobacteraeota bacterium]|nr:DUF4386 domain-containing protein [Candidatus Eremiobacteraeota bacterium]
MRSRSARIAGVLYLLSVVVGWYFLRYLPDRFIADGDAVATAHNIAANASFFHVAIAGDLLLGVLWLAVVLALYRALENVDPFTALLMLVLGAYMQVPLYFVNAANYAGALFFATDTSVLAAFPEGQRSALVMAFIRFHHIQLLASFVFAGLWLFPLGILVWKSRVVPRFLSVWLILNGFAWLAVVLAGFLAPQYASSVGTLAIPFELGEILTACWLAIAPRGERTPL